ncbi:MAG: hypothetical protein F4Z97_03720, partial [Gammaproteobacteria bacterium]|nr:hypothetical protein [Gammaproteobacteria bacterium]
MNVSEGGSADYAVSLKSPPSVDFNVLITGHSDTELTLSSESLSFSPANWRIPQMVTVSAAQDDDALDDVVTLTHAASGGNYNSVTASVVVTIDDDDEAALVFSQTELGITEGGSARYEARLASRPSDEVEVLISGHSGSDLTVSPTTLRYPPQNWWLPQTVTVSAGEDDNEAGESITLTHTASGGDYASKQGDVTVTVADNDWRARVSLAADSVNDLKISEDGSRVSNLMAKSFPATPPGTNKGIPVSICFSSSLSDFGFNLVYSGLTRTLDSSGCNLNAPLRISGDSAQRRSRFWLDPIADAVDEPDEVVTVTVLANPEYPLPAGVQINTAANSRVVTIEDDDPTVVSLARTGSGAISEGGSVGFTVSLGRVLVAGEIIDVPLSISGSGVVPADWLLVKNPGSANTGVRLINSRTAKPAVRFAGAGAETATLLLEAAVDNTDEGDGTEIFEVALGADGTVANGFDRTSLQTNVGGGADPHETDNAFSVTVSDATSPPLAFFTQASSSALESGGTQSVTVRLSSAPTADVTIGYSVGGREVAGTDFKIAGSTTVVANTVEAVIEISLIDDDAVELGEIRTVELTLETGTGYAVSSRRPRHVLSVADDDESLLSITAPADAGEGDSGVTDRLYTVGLSAASSSDVSYKICFSGTATIDLTKADLTQADAVPSADYQPLLDGEAFGAHCIAQRIPAGALASDRAVGIRVRGDTSLEQHENVTATLNLIGKPPLGVGIGEKQATHRIHEDDSLSLSIHAPESALEGDAGSAVKNFDVRLSAPAPSAFTYSICFRAAVSTATNNKDYRAIAKTGTRYNGCRQFSMPKSLVSSGADVRMLVYGDAVYEGDETVVVSLRSNGLPSGVVLAPAASSATYTITDDEPVV